MSDYDRNTRGPGYPNHIENRNWSSGSWLAGIIVAVLVIIALGYAFSDRWSGSSMTENRASATDTAPVTAPAPIAPKPAATPTATPSP